MDEKNPLFPLLREFPNVAFTGFKPLVDLPDYLGRFDVCLDFLRRRDVGSDIIPCRIYEYLSTGKPIVSMLYEDQVEEFPDVIYGAHTPPGVRPALPAGAFRGGRLGAPPPQGLRRGRRLERARRRGLPDSGQHRTVLNGQAG